MHIKHILIFYIGILTCLFLSNCQDETSPVKDTKSLGVNVRRTSNIGNRGLNEARQFYMDNSTPTLKSRGTDETNSYSKYFPYLRKEPSWDFYVCNQKDSMQVVEVDLTDCISQDYILKENWEAYKKYKQHKYLRSYTRYIYIRYLSSGRERAFYMTIVPTIDCVRNFSNRIYRNTYLQRNKYLSGYILYHELNGAFINGWEYKNGKITGKIVSPHLAMDVSEKRPLILGKINSAYNVELKVTTLSLETTQPEESDPGWDWDLGELPEVVVKPETGSGSGEGSGDGSGTGSGEDSEVGTPDPGWDWDLGELPEVEVTPDPGSEDSGSDDDPPVVIPDNGGGSGGGGVAPPNVIAPKAKKIFRNSNMTDQNWQIIENMLNKIIANCMGGNLYNAIVNHLDGKTLAIEFRTGSNGEFGFKNGTSKIVLGMQMESNQLFHEMWHAYQAYQETTTTWTNALLNLEIETWYAQYLYTSSLPEYKKSKWEQRDKTDPRRIQIKNIKNYVDSHGVLNSNTSQELLDDHIYNYVIPEFKNNGYSSYNYEYSRIGTNNLNNLNKLTVNCL